MSSRFAIYFSPALQSPWWDFGAGWLGRDDHKNTILQQPVCAGLTTADHQRITAEPRRYGFHATLKAPFRLAEGVGEAGLLKHTHALARTLKPLPLGLMRIALLDDFLALVPDAVPPQLDPLARRCVLELDALRAPLSDEERSRRRPENLDERARQLLELHGYSHVLERFRLHMTLTGKITGLETRLVTNALGGQIGRLNTESPLVLDRLCVFVEKETGAPSCRIADLLLGKP
ncbi:MAG: hypothetical protein JWQ72_2478 [Polaromonas sp.]|nr:hypothetical protein [Polaromonas sp.]